MPSPHDRWIRAIDLWSVHDGWPGTSTRTHDCRREIEGMSTGTAALIVLSKMHQVAHPDTTNRILVERTHRDARCLPLIAAAGTSVWERRAYRLRTSYYRH